MNVATSPFTETCGQAIEAIRLEMEANKAVPTAEYTEWLDMFGNGGVPYGTRRDAHAELATYKGKGTRKYAHATIYRMDSGRYEWLVYFL